jgi:hypothetical protein
MKCKAETDSRRALVLEIEARLADALPDGWKFERITRDYDDPRNPLPPLWWNLKKSKTLPPEHFCQDFGLHISDDLQWLLLTYGNTDIGPGTTVQQNFVPARVIRFSKLEAYPLKSLIDFAFQNLPPNQWGYT